jgi:mRNA interferase YafQ
VATGEGPPPRTVVTSKQYEKDAKRVRKQGKDMARLVAVVDALRNRRPLDSRHRDHALAGDWRDYRECHIQPDWLLIYRLDERAVALARTGSHSDLFG